VLRRALLRVSGLSWSYPCYAHEGQLRHRHHEDQTEQALCLTVLTNAIVAWTTEYLGLAADQLQADSRQIDNQVLALISPAHNENIDFYGTFSFEVDQELAQLPGGYRPLRQPRQEDLNARS